MKNRLFIGLAFALVASFTAHAGAPTVPALESSGTPTFMIGIAVEFGESVNKTDIGLTAKVLSTNQPDKFVVGAGVSYFPWAKDQFGIDASAGYNFNTVAAMAGYDFLRWKPQMSAGYVPTSRHFYCADPTYSLSGETCNLPIPSDARLKRDIHLVAIRDDDMKIYSFKYLWSDETYVGVMAQDLLQNPSWAHAVILRNNGFYAVNYRSLNLRMTTLQQWQKNGMSAVTIASIDERLHLKKAA